MEAAEIRDRKKNLVQPLPQQPITITTTEGEKIYEFKAGNTAESQRKTELIYEHIGHCGSL